MTQPNIVIIGAGPAGLSVAYNLDLENINSSIFEGGNAVGGLAGSVKLWGEKYDVGPHIFLESCQIEAVALWKELGASELQYLHLTRGMILKKNLISFPPKPYGLLKTLGFEKLAAAGINLLATKAQRSKPIVSAGDFFSQKFGGKFRDLVFGPFCEKYMGLVDSAVDAGFATELTSFAADRESDEAPFDKKKSQTILYPLGGTQLIWSRMAEKFTGNTTLTFGKKLKKVCTNGKRITEIYFSDGTVVNPDFLVSSMPIVSFLNLIDNCPKNILAESSRVKSRSTILVYLKINTTAFNYQYITVFDHSLQVGRITNFNSWQNTPAKESVLCLEYWCSQTDSIWNSDDETITSLAINEMEQVNILRKENIVKSEIFRISNSHPVLSLDYKNSLKVINEYFGEFENLLLTGRHANFKWDGQADNIVNGRNIAQTIKKFLSHSKPQLR